MLLNMDNMARKYKGLLMEFAILVATAVVAIQGKKEDDLSEHEAQQIYGRQWLKDRTQRGLLKFNRSGATNRSAKVYSRLEIESLKLTEKGLLAYVQRGNEEVERAKDRLTEFMDRFKK